MNDRERLQELITARTRAILELPVALKAVFPCGAVVSVPLTDGRTVEGTVAGLSMGDVMVTIGGKSHWVTIQHLLTANPAAGLKLAEVA